MNVTLRPGYLARYVTLEARPAFASASASLVAIDDNGAAFNVTGVEPFATMRDACDYLQTLPSRRLWVTPLDRKPSAYAMPGGAIIEARA